MKWHFEIVSPSQLDSHVDVLRSIEGGISYPIDAGKDSFTIDHGLLYHPFFSEMGKVRFVLAFANGELVGSVAGIWKTAHFGNKEVTGLYVADLKLLPSARGQGIAKKMIWHAFLRWPFNQDYQGWSFAYFAAMQGEKGGVRQSFSSKTHLGRLTRPVASLNVYFATVEQLLSMPNAGPVADLACGLNFSPLHQNLTKCNAGKKDFLLNSTGEPWRLIHLKPMGGGGSFVGSHLRTAGQWMSSNAPDALGCFAVDQRLASLVSWLASNGLPSSTTCLIHGVSFFCKSMRLYPWVEISTAEI